MQSDDSAFVCQMSIKHLGLFAAKKTLVLMSGGMFTAYEGPQVEMVCFSFLKGFQSGRQSFNTGLLLDCISIKWMKLTVSTVVLMQLSAMEKIQQNDSSVE